MNDNELLKNLDKLPGYILTVNAYSYTIITAHKDNRV